MAEVLSQSEIDALLAAVSVGNVETEGAEEAKSPADWIAYDLASQERIVKSRMAALEGIHERFSRMFRVTLSNTLKKNVTVTPTSTDFLKFGDYLTNIMLPTSLNILSLPKLKGSMLYVVSSKLTYALVDAYYGGSERPFSKIGGREEFTTIENNMIRKICMLAVRDLKEAWRLNYPIDIDYVRSESNPHFVGVIHSSELVAVVTFEVEFENLSGPFVIIIQLKALEPVQQFLAVNVTGELLADKSAWRNHWTQEILEMPLNVAARLGTTSKTLAELQSWKPGDVLTLNQDAALPLDVLVENVNKYQGMMGTLRGSTAVRLTEVIEPVHQIEKNIP